MDIKNPLHGKYAKPIGGEEAAATTNPVAPPSNSGGQSAGEKADFSKFKVVGFFILVTIALYPIIFGVGDIFSSRSFGKRFQKNFRNPAIVVEHKEVVEPSLFERLFCRGARRSSWCDNRDNSRR